MFRFVKSYLAKLASEGNSVLALVDEGCGKEEDLVAMMSVADGILRLQTRDHSRTLDIVKHPRVEPTTIEVPIEPREPQVRPPIEWDPDVIAQIARSRFLGKAARREVGDYVNLFWPNLAHWSCMLWDPKGFPTMLYEMNKYEVTSVKDQLPSYPGSIRLATKVLFALRSLGLVKDMRKMFRALTLSTAAAERSGALEYRDDLSAPDEHHFRVYENSDCIGFENVGVPMASYLPPTLAGDCQMLDRDGREWNAIETKCLGLGDPYCEIKVVAGEIDGLRASLAKDGSLVERIHERLTDQLMGYLLHGRPLVERPKLGSDVFLHVLIHGMGPLNLAGERYRRAQMMGAARSARMIGERLMEAGLDEDQAVRRVLDFMNDCKVGKVTLGETIRIRENCESWRTTILMHRKQPSCFFTTGFLNGLFSAVKGQHVREVRCLAAGDPYCEWETV
jgi:predicted hydrocarbon binding protein